MPTALVTKWFVSATLLSVFICSLSCRKPEDQRQPDYIPISGEVYDTSINRGVAGVWIFLGQRPAFYGIGNGPAYDFYDSVRTDSAGNYRYLIEYEEHKDYFVQPGVPLGYSYADGKQVFWRRDSIGKMVPLKIDFLLVR